MPPVDLEHSGIEIGDGQHRGRRQQIAQSAADDAGAGGDFQYTKWRSGGGPSGDVIGEIDKEYRAQSGVVICRQIAGDLREKDLTIAARSDCSLAHDPPPLRL